MQIPTFLAATTFLLAIASVRADEATTTAAMVEEAPGFAAIEPPPTDQITAACPAATAKYCADERDNLNMHRVADCLFGHIGYLVRAKKQTACRKAVFTYQKAAAKKSASGVAKACYTCPLNPDNDPCLLRR